MLRKLYALFFLILLPASANALSIASITNANCSGSLTTSLLDGALFACAGNLTLDGGFVTSDSLINISADGDLFVDNLTFTAPMVNFSIVTGMLTIGSAVVVNTTTAIVQNSPKAIVSWNEFNIPQGSGAVLSIGGEIDLGVKVGAGYVLRQNGDLQVTGGSINVGSGGLLTTTDGNSSAPTLVLTAVPEPTTYAMMLAGILMLVSFRRKI